MPTSRPNSASRARSASACSERHEQPGPAPAEIGGDHDGGKVYQVRRPFTRNGTQLPLKDESEYQGSNHSAVSPGL